ncbi:ComEC/Rec2 family competence protein [Pedobacter borealis]|uniref:ComEC/Rec2 family competence protein n=1 Tax=Pedobacter borealis TaxID=475254 RepID=UPI000493978D|nr:MBL fold metallo-hydrolase [Pedobacter borealis]
MTRIHVVQAQFGDSIIIEFGTPNERKFILIDGGPSGVYNNHLRGEIENIIGAEGTLDALIVSHIDTDHIKGVLDLLTEIKKQRDQGKDEILSIKELWHNSFSNTIDLDGTITNQVEKICEVMGNQSMDMEHAQMVISSQNEANKVRTFANYLEIPINISTNDNFFSLEKTSDPISFGNLTLTITGPTTENLLALRDEWNEWTENRIQEISDGKFDMTAYSDDTAPNLSSITFLATIDEKKILFTGDARGDHIIEGLKKRKLLMYGKLHVDILKVPHHGSDRNTSREFFETITADRYVISANGKHQNPDYATLSWIVEVAKKQGRQIEIIITNETPSTKKILKDYDPTEYGYSITYIDHGKNSVSLTL